MSFLKLVGTCEELSSLWRAHRGAHPPEARRDVLLLLECNGPMSVPQIARSRRVTRQSIQVAVNALHDAKLLELCHNPAHAKSPMFALSDAGAAMCRAIRFYEGALALAVPIDVSDEALAEAIRVLEAALVSLNTQT